MNVLKPLSSSLLIHRSLLWTMGVGFLLLTGIILFSGDINAVLAETTSATANQPVAAVPIATSQLMVVPASTALPVDDIQSILDHPENFRVVPPDIMPAQAIIEGKTIKFLMGL